VNSIIQSPNGSNDRLSNPFSRPSFSADGWADILLLSDKYMMKDIRLGSIKRLRASRPPLNAIKMIEVARKADAQSLYEEAINELAGRNDIISLGDARKIGIEAFHEIYSLQLSRNDGRAHKRPRISKLVSDPLIIDWANLAESLKIERAQSSCN
jgi:hypothetical protein